MFDTFIVQPIFNLLVLIYALLPGHNFGLAIIIFTIVIRFLMWPLIKKQLHQAKAMRALQPELKKIKKATKGNRQQESVMVMELYKERNINPFASFGVILLQLPILFGLYIGITKIINDPQQMVDFAYPALRNLGSMKEIAADISKFDTTLLGFVDLTRSALGEPGFYLPAMVLVVLSAIVQYFQTKQLMPQSDDSRGLRQILKDAGNGKQADQSEVNAAVGRTTQYLIPIMILVISVGLAAALPLYWLIGGVVAYFQQSYILNQDKDELVAAADATETTDVIEGEVIEQSQNTKSKTKKKKASPSSKKRRK